MSELQEKLLSVLLVEDDAVLSLELEEFLRDDGFDVRCVSTVADAECALDPRSPLRESVLPNLWRLDTAQLCQGISFRYAQATAVAMCLPRTRRWFEQTPRRSNPFRLKRHGPDRK